MTDPVRKLPRLSVDVYSDAAWIAHLDAMIATMCVSFAWSDDEKEAIVSDLMDRKFAALAAKGAL